jgi:hypothetical protein
MAKGLVARSLHITEVMEELGPNLGSPHTKATGDKLLEMSSEMLTLVLAHTSKTLSHPFITAPIAVHSVSHSIYRISITSFCSPVSCVFDGKKSAGTRI